MFMKTFKSLNEMHMVVLGTKRLCANYWVGFTSLSNEQDPIKKGFFCEESGN